MPEIIIIGDAHGELETVKALIKQVESSASEIIFVGDVIDRGPDSIGTLDYIIENDFSMVLGNHEAVMLEDLIINPNAGHSLWLDSGGISTMMEYKKAGNQILQKHLKYLTDVPLYLHRAIKDEQGRELVVTHAPIGDNSLGKGYNKLGINDYVFPRKIPKKKSEFFNVFGHNVVHDFVRNKSKCIVVPRETYDEEKEVVINNDLGYAAIDSGVIKYGKLTAIGFPSKRIFQQEVIRS